MEEIYPTASAKSKEDPAYKEAAMEATFKLQNGVKGYRALWKHILNVSIADLKNNYKNLNVDFDVWKGESDAQPYIPDMVERMKKDGFAYQSEGALVVDVSEESDSKEVPPCIILKSDGASLYSTTDLATLVMRMEENAPQEVIYVADKRQELHFIQVFRCAKKTGVVNEDTELKFLGFGTMNGKDGKPFKTREGGVMRLEHLIRDITDKMQDKINENRTVAEEEAAKVAEKEAKQKTKEKKKTANKKSVVERAATNAASTFTREAGKDLVNTLLGKKSTSKKSALEKAANSALSTLTGTLGKSLTRGLFDILKDKE